MKYSVCMFLLCVCSSVCVCYIVCVNRAHLHVCVSVCHTCTNGIWMQFSEYGISNWRRTLGKYSKSQQQFTQNVYKWNTMTLESVKIYLMLFQKFRRMCTCTMHTNTHTNQFVWSSKLCAVSVKGHESDNGDRQQRWRWRQRKSITATRNMRRSECGMVVMVVAASQLDDEVSGENFRKQRLLQSAENHLTEEQQTSFQQHKCSHGPAVFKPVLRYSWMPIFFLSRCCMAHNRIHCLDANTPKRTHTHTLMRARKHFQTTNTRRYVKVLIIKLWMWIMTRSPMCLCCFTGWRAVVVVLHVMGLFSASSQNRYLSECSLIRWA